jgi:hypothetical protein
MSGEQLVEKQAFLPQADTTQDSLHRGNFMQPGDKTQRITNLGDISKIDLPASWHQYQLSPGSTTFSSPEAGAPQITFRDHSSDSALTHLLSEKSSGSKILYSDAFKEDAATSTLINSIAGALGSSLVGDNQVTNPPAENEGRQPAFHMQTAKVEQLAGRNVLVVNGWFNQNDNMGHPKMGPDGPLKRYYTGVFSTRNSGKVDELYLQADSDAALAKGQTAFKSALTSIKWK